MEHVDSNDIKTTIFNNKFYEIIIGNHDDQINFLKIYPLFKKNQNIITLWKDYYVKINSDTSLQNKLNKEAMVDFLSFALEHDLVEYKTKEILSVLTLMDTYNEVPFKDLIKSSIIKGKTNACIKKISLIDDPYVYDKNPNIKLKDLSPYDIAQELTRKFAFLFSKISYHELLFVAQHDNKYNKNENDLITPIEILVSDFHKLSYIVFYTILIEDKNDMARINTIKHVLKICEELKNLGNYHAIFALISALNNNIIQRLDNLWKIKKNSNIFTDSGESDTLWKSKKNNNIFTELSELINPCNNYKNYRNIIKKHVKNNIIPYIAVSICDIKHVLEYPLYDIPNNNFNMEIYNIILTILNNFKNMQLSYTINKNEAIYKWFSNINIVTTELEFYEISNKIKPNVHKQLIDQLIENKEKEPEIPKLILHTESTNLILNDCNNSNRSHDSVDDVIKLTNIPKNTRKTRHKSMPIRISQNINNLENRTSSDKIIDCNLWLINDVQLWLYNINMQQYCDVFKNEAIDGLALLNLTNDNLKNDMGILKLGHRLRILEEIKNLKYDNYD
jgi:hypothetical protein